MTIFIPLDVLRGLLVLAIGFGGAFFIWWVIRLIVRGDR